jgi:hypothetical protein
MENNLKPVLEVKLNVEKLMRTKIKGERISQYLTSTASQVKSFKLQITVYYWHQTKLIG